MTPRTVLIVDDEPSLRESLERELVRAGFAVRTASDGETGLQAASEEPVDLVLTDAALPGLDGHALCRALKRDRRTGRLPVILMSGQRLEERDVIAGLDGGADDYVAKPFRMRVLLARVRAALRRAGMEPEPARKLRAGVIELDPEAREVRVAGRPATLTRKEFELLALLLRNARKAVSVGTILESVWGPDPAGERDPHTVEAHVFSLRRKLGPKAARRIVNVRGYGYKFAP